MLRKLFILCLIFIVYPLQAQEKEDVDWLIYLYLVGSDLESGGEHPELGGNATRDLQEILDSQLSDNIKLVVMTGGTSRWQNDVIRSDKVQIFETKNQELVLKNEFAPLNMGNPDTLDRLISHGESRFNPQKRMIIFWDHGAGSTGGVGYDETQGGDFLSMPEIQSVFRRHFPEGIPFEIVGFDACLMANIDVAYYMGQFGKYLVASEETEPSIGWDYIGWLEKLKNNPQMDGQELGKAIADSYLAACRKYDLENVTLSVVDLSRFFAAGFAYFSLGDRLMTYISHHPEQSSSVLSHLAQAANKAERYGGDTFLDSIDLYDYISNISRYADPEIRAVTLNFIRDSVVYKVNGNARNSKGLSVYYPLSHSREAFHGVYENGMRNPFYCLSAMSMGISQNYNFSDDFKFVRDFLWKKVRVIMNGEQEDKASREQVTLPETSPMANINLQDFTEGAYSHIAPPDSELKGLVLEPKFDKDSNSYIQIPEKYLDKIQSVEFMPALFVLSTDKEDGFAAVIGTDDSIMEDWDRGIFTIQFNNSRPHLGEHLLPGTFVNSFDSISRYLSHVRINGVDATLEFIYDYETGKYTVVGITRNSETGVPTRQNITLKEGDIITTIMTGLKLSQDDSDEEKEFQFEYETFRYSNSMQLTRKELAADATYALILRVTSFGGDKVEAEPVIYIVPEDKNAPMQVFSADEYVSYLQDKQDDVSDPEDDHEESSDPDEDDSDFENDDDRDDDDS